MQDEDLSTRPVNFIRFHGLSLLVVRNGSIDYIPARPLCDLAGVQWKGAQRGLLEGDSAILFGTKRLQAPQIDGGGTLKCPGNGVVYIRLDRSRMYLARISTDRMRANGKAEAADDMLALQIEWADALHSYETNGIAMKAGRDTDLKALKALLDSYSRCGDARRRSALDFLIDERLWQLNVPRHLLEEPQQFLPLTTSK